MSILDGIFKKGDDSVKAKTEDTAKLSLRKEELDIAKSRAQKGDVEIGKEILEEHKKVDVPVSCEEVVIERRSLNNEASDSPITSEETIKIPISEEKVDVNKHTVVTGEILAHKREIENTAHIDETLKREEARINKVGDANIIDDGIDHS
ncbi:YsnF/AvaK domain-containing protein [Clostridium algoriphilum]|uniref:YsnF/AvaK domain-containing protein n=1 Tax=Clostridium algoriphilum TaxID=198347 RepID=UPI001CF352EB|nr:YsnF/AvaK domain-containing protein [Clostridium algoriphilum]MCB2294921.1 YsnF/AvaK domain-containing protein [Clostridium algoriphilum]